MNTTSNLNNKTTSNTVLQNNSMANKNNTRDKENNYTQELEEQMKKLQHCMGIQKRQYYHYKPVIVFKRLSQQDDSLTLHVNNVSLKQSLSCEKVARELPRVGASLFINNNTKRTNLKQDTSPKSGSKIIKNNKIAKSEKRIKRTIPYKHITITNAIITNTNTNNNMLLLMPTIIKSINQTSSNGSIGNNNSSVSGNSINNGSINNSNIGRDGIGNIGSSSNVSSTSICNTNNTGSSNTSNSSSSNNNNGGKSGDNQSTNLVETSTSRTPSSTIKSTSPTLGVPLRPNLPTIPTKNTHQSPGRQDTQIVNSNIPLNSGVHVTRQQGTCNVIHGSSVEQSAIQNTRPSDTKPDSRQEASLSSHNTGQDIKGHAKYTSTNQNIKTTNNNSQSDNPIKVQANKRDSVFAVPKPRAPKVKSITLLDCGNVSGKSLTQVPTASSQTPTTTRPTTPTIQVTTPISQSLSMPTESTIPSPTKTTMTSSVIETRSSTNSCDAVPLCTRTNAPTIVQPKNIICCNCSGNAVDLVGTSACIVCKGITCMACSSVYSCNTCQGVTCKPCVRNKENQCIVCDKNVCCSVITCTYCEGEETKMCHECAQARNGKRVCCMQCGESFVYKK
jgi:hypothetical protein